MSVDGGSVLNVLLKDLPVVAEAAVARVRPLRRPDSFMIVVLREFGKKVE